MALRGRRDALASMRGVLAARGAACIVLALLTLAWPTVAVAVVVRVFAAYLIVDGLLALWSVWRYEHTSGTRAPSAIQAVLELAGGTLALALPDRAATLLTAGVGVWAVATGILVLGGTALYWRRVPMKSPLVLGSLLVGALGAVLVAQPAAALAGVGGSLGLIAVTAALAGALLLLLAWSLPTASATPGSGSSA